MTAVRLDHARASRVMQKVVRELSATLLSHRVTEDLGVSTSVQKLGVTPKALLNKTDS